MRWNRQIAGQMPQRNIFRINSVKGRAKSEAHRFKNIVAMPSGPVALSCRNLRKARSTFRVRTGKKPSSPTFSGFNVAYSFVVACGKDDLCKNVSANNSARSFAVRAQDLSVRCKDCTEELAEDLPCNALLNFHHFFDEDGKSFNSRLVRATCASYSSQRICEHRSRSKTSRSVPLASNFVAIAFRHRSFNQGCVETLSRDFRQQIRLRITSVIRSSNNRAASSHVFVENKSSHGIFAKSSRMRSHGARL